MLRSVAESSVMWQPWHFAGSFFTRCQEAKAKLLLFGDFTGSSNKTTQDETCLSQLMRLTDGLWKMRLTLEICISLILCMFISLTVWFNIMKCFKFCVGVLTKRQKRHKTKWAGNFMQTLMLKNLFTHTKALCDARPSVFSPASPVVLC